MAPRVVFFSYARRDADATKAIAEGLQDLGQTVWLDRQLSGGQQWWDTILEQIRSCDIFLFVLSESSLRSKACRAELDYAHRLDRTILPVSVHHVIDQLLPPFLAETQRVDGADLVQLARALLALPSPPALPDPLPPPPPVPLSYLDELADSLNRDDLPLVDQRNLLGALKQLVREDDEREAAVELLRRLRRHPQANAWVAEEIDAELAKLEPPASTEGTAGVAGSGGSHPAPTDSPRQMAQGPPPSPSTERITVPPPPPQRPAGPAPGRRPADRPTAAPGPLPPRRRSRAVLLVALLAVALGGVGIGVAAVVGQSDNEPDPPPVTDDTTPTTLDTTTTDTTEPTDPEIDLAGLRDACGGGDMAACDELFFQSDFGSDDEAFGSFCGGLSVEPLEGGCEAFFG